MKHKITLGVLLLAVVLFSGCAQQQSKMEYIGADSAKAAALEAAGLQASDAAFSSTTLENHNGLDYYDVVFSAGGQEYRYSVEALTGVVVEMPAQTSDTPLVTDADTFSPSGTPDAASGSEGNPSSQTKPDAAQGQSVSGTGISAEDAKAKALEHAGLQESEVSMIHVKPDYDDGRQVYEVEFYTSDYQEYDYEIDALTGDVISYDYDAEWYAPSSSNAGNNITEEEAKKLALSLVPGATVADIVEFETDHDDGRTEYEGKIIYDGMKYEFEIDAYSGSFRSWETEPLKY